MITVTQSAIDKLTEIIADSEMPSAFLRVYVQGGGCAGFQYGFTLDDTITDDDVTIPVTSSLKVVVDLMSYQYVENATVDYTEDLTGAQFLVNNPNATSLCGCGSSFSV